MPAVMGVVQIMVKYDTILEVKKTYNLKIRFRDLKFKNIKSTGGFAKEMKSFRKESVFTFYKKW
jgi:hypothetical protein